MLTTYCVSDLCRILFKTAISFQPSHDLSQIRIIITEEETGPGSLSKRPEACRVDGRRTSQAIKQNETETKTQTGPLLRPRLTDGLGEQSSEPRVLPGARIASAWRSRLSVRRLTGSRSCFLEAVPRPLAAASPCSCFSPGPVTQHTAPGGFLHCQPRQWGC